MAETTLHRELGLNDSEYARIQSIMGREPTLTELGMFSVMWSEHCGYKYSRPILSLFRRYREAQEKGALENAGITPLDNQFGIVMKMESHNHPSAVEPYQGAATGVGGILRDIFTMGARPIANLNSLRFGPLDDAHNRYLFERVVAGIGDYGNCVGVPTVAGEIYFHRCYSGNPLVNAMAVGLVPLSHIASAKAEGIGNLVLYVGSSTGKDGIQGASFASVEIGPDSESKRPNVQMGDPFMEKLLIEATLEALATGAITGIQDMGAAGLTCSTCETAAKACTGMVIDIQKVPRREANMTPFEVMLSESQERMLCIVQKGEEDKVSRVFTKWGLQAAIIGKVTGDGFIRVMDGDQEAACIPARALTDQCPTYHLDAAQPAYLSELTSLDPLNYSEPDSYEDVLLRLLNQPSIADKSWVTQQYDSMVQTQSAYLPGADAAVLRIHGTKRGIALKVDGNARYCFLDPYVGAQVAVAEAARNVVCVGARPAAVTDCLNFANPEKTETFWQFQRAVEGIAAACDVLETPVISGNVSFYNETQEFGPIYPTPTIGMLGILDDIHNRCDARFCQEGNPILLLRSDSDPTGGLGGSEYLAVVHEIEAGRPPAIDLAAEKRLHQLLLTLIQQKLLVSAHDCSDGGLAVCLAEKAMLGRIGASILLRSIDFDNLPPSAIFFGETQSRIVVSVRSESYIKMLEQIADQYQVKAQWIGTVGGGRLRLSLDGKEIVNLPLETMERRWRTAIPNWMDGAETQSVLKAV